MDKRHCQEEERTGSHQGEGAHDFEGKREIDLSSTPDYKGAAKIWEILLPVSCGLFCLCWFGLSTGPGTLPEPMLRAMIPLRFFGLVVAGLSLTFFCTFRYLAKKHNQP